MNYKSYTADKDRSSRQKSAKATFQYNQELHTASSKKERKVALVKENEARIAHWQELKDIRDAAAVEAAKAAEIAAAEIALHKAEEDAAAKAFAEAEKADDMRAAEVDEKINAVAEAVVSPTEPTSAPQGV